MNPVTSDCWRNTVRKLSAAFLAVIALARVAVAQWQVVSTETQSGATGLEHRHVVVENAVSHDRATLDIALFPAKSATLRVIDNSGGSDSLAEVMLREKCAAGVNGGFFDTSFKPIGLRVIGGAMTSPLVRARLLTGVLCGSRRGIEIVRLAEFSRRRKVDAAVECGPFLVDAGAHVAGLDAKRSARRTFAAIGRGGKTALLGVATELTLAQLSDVLAGHPFAKDFQIWRAMNFDGGSSSAFWFRNADGGVFSISEDKAVRDFVGVVGK